MSNFMMSENTEQSGWSLDGESGLDNLDKQIHLVSTSPSSQSSVHVREMNGPYCKMETLSEDVKPLTQSLESLLSIQEVKSISPGKLHSSCTDIFVSQEDVKQSPLLKKQLSKRSASYDCIQSKRRLGGSKKYDHVESKIKQYFGTNDNSKKEKSVEPKAAASSLKTNHNDLEEINRKLTLELNDKNTLLMKLQDSYEQLLLKYAEAQNKIDQLRMKTTINLTPDYSSRSGIKQKSSRTSFRVPLHTLYSSATDTVEDTAEGRCQAIVAPFMKNDIEKQDEISNSMIHRPQSLPIDTHMKVMERDILKATTPTDSEGVSSVITSMSGHSKILSTLDEENDKKTKEQLKFQTTDFVLDETPAVNDPYNKVKNWQNSLPPLELIETPETILYDMSPKNMAEADVSPSTNYNELTETLPADKEKCTWHENTSSDADFTKTKAVSQDVMKKYLRTLSLPSSLSKRNLMAMIYKRKNHTIDMCGAGSHMERDEYTSLPQAISEQPTSGDLPASSILRRHRKKPPLLRSSSLPVYDYDSPKSGSCRNNMFIPPLDLDNITISDDSTFPDVGFTQSKGNIMTSPSFVTSRGDSADCSFQTLQSLNSCKATISEFSDSAFVRDHRLTFHKSTSITPDRSKEMIFPTLYEFNSSDLGAKTETVQRSPNECDMINDPKNWCNVCGETIAEQRLGGPFKAASYHSMMESSMKPPPPRRNKHPFNRSVSFNSENSPEYCFHSPRNAYHRRSHDESLDQFDIYANNLKTRSQVIMKALTAHVNNS